MELLICVTIESMYNITGNMDIIGTWTFF